MVHFAIPAPQPDIHTSGLSPWRTAVSRRSSYRSEVSRRTQRLVWSVVLLLW